MIMSYNSFEPCGSLFCKMQNSECRKQQLVKCEILLQNQNRLGLWLLIGLSSVFAPYCINAVTNRTCGGVHILPFSS